MIKEESSDDRNRSDNERTAHNFDTDVRSSRKRRQSGTKIHLSSGGVEKEVRLLDDEAKIRSKVCRNFSIGNAKSHASRINHQGSLICSHLDDGIGSVIQSEKEFGDVEANDLFTARQSEFLDHNEVSFNVL